MRYICAQPATTYYVWQVEVMIANFIKNGINPNNIDIVCLVGDIIPEEWIKLSKGYPARFFFYHDTRKTKNYISSIRPNILKQHFLKHPYLSEEVIFYHDCDIIFTKPVDFSKFETDDKWYGSDTRWYIGHDYILSKGEDILDKMCDIVGINKQIVKDNELNTIGAQYIMKGINYAFWDNVEIDSERLFKEITDINNEKKEKDPSYHELQIWCSDMWVVLWNGWKLGKETLCVPELEFSWGTGSIEDFDKFNIFHNAGVVNSQGGLFYKADYQNSYPYEIILDIKENSASGRYWKEIQEICKKSVLKKVNIGIVVLATNAYFVLGIRFIKRFMQFYKGNTKITFYFFSDTNPEYYLPDNIDVEYFYVSNDSWVDGTNLKFTSVLSINNRLRSDYLFYFDADTNVNVDFTEDWFLGDMVGGQHYGDQDWMIEKKSFDRNILSKAYIPEDTKLPQMYYYGAFFGGTSKNMINFCTTMKYYQSEDEKISYEPVVNDESYINREFHFNPPTKVVLCNDFLFSVSDKGGIGDTRYVDLDVEEMKKTLLKNRNINIDIQNNKIIMTEFKQTWWDNNLPNRFDEFNTWIGDKTAQSKSYFREYVIKKNYKTLIDVGCGNASEYFGYKEECPELEYLGIDSCKVLYDKNIENGVPMLLSSGENTNLIDSHSDVVFARHVFEHQPSFLPVLSEMIRIGSKEVIHVFFIAPGDNDEHIGYDNSENLYHNRYSKSDIEEYLLLNKKVESFLWDIINNSETALVVKLKLSE